MMREPAQTNIKFVSRLSALLLIGGLLLGCGPQPSNNPPATSVPQATATEAVTAPAATLPTSPTTPAASQPTAETPSAAETDVATPDGTAPILETGDAVVENIEVRILESFPVQVHAVLTGYLPDGCTTITGSEVVTAGTTFRIRLTTERPEDAICTRPLSLLKRWCHWMCQGCQRALTKWRSMIYGLLLNCQEMGPEPHQQQMRGPVFQAHIRWWRHPSAISLPRQMCLSVLRRLKMVL